MEATEITPPADRRGIDIDAQELLYRGWLDAITRADEDALAQLYDATLGKVYGMALRITGTAQTAEEVVSDVFMQVWNNAAHYRPERGKVISWLLTICRSRALDSLRRKDSALTHPEPSALRPDLDFDDNNPEDLLCALERASALYAALTTLSLVQRQLISLAFYQGLSHQEIADETALPLGTVKSHIRKALAALEQSLDADNLREGML